MRKEKLANYSANRQRKVIKNEKPIHFITKNSTLSFPSFGFKIDLNRE